MRLHYQFVMGKEGSARPERLLNADLGPGVMGHHLGAPTARSIYTPTTGACTNRPRKCRANDRPRRRQIIWWVGECVV